MPTYAQSLPVLNGKMPKQCAVQGCCRCTSYIDANLDSTLPPNALWVPDKTLIRTMSVGAELCTQAVPSGSAVGASATRLFAIWQLQNSTDNSKFHIRMKWLLAHKHPTLYCDELFCLLSFVFPYVPGGDPEPQGFRVIDVYSDTGSRIEFLASEER